MSSALTHLAGPLTYLVALLIVGGLLFLIASFAFGRGERLAPMPPDVSPVVLPAARRVTGRDLRRLRMSVVLRGYRMSEVDWILDQLAEQIEERDRELARLNGEAGDPARTDQVPADPVGAAQPDRLRTDPVDQASHVDSVDSVDSVEDAGPVEDRDRDRVEDRDRAEEGRHG